MPNGSLFFVLRHIKEVTQYTYTFTLKKIRGNCFTKCGTKSNKMQN